MIEFSELSIKGSLNLVKLLTINVIILESNSELVGSYYEVLTFVPFFVMKIWLLFFCQSYIGEAKAFEEVSFSQFCFVCRSILNFLLKL
jgi:hypothetical protein